jgi:hypothetical protein
MHLLYGIGPRVIVYCAQKLNQCQLMNARYVHCENTTDKKRQNKTCTCVCKMSLVRSYLYEAPETGESVIEELFSNHSMFHVINNLYHHTNCVCIPTESSNCPFEKRAGLHINVSLIFYFLLQAKVAAH